MGWLLAKLRWMWNEPARQFVAPFGAEPLSAESSFAWDFRPEVTSLDQWMDLNA